MNYRAPILVGVFAIIVGLWYSIGKSFEGPRIDWEMLKLSN